MYNFILNKSYHEWPQQFITDAELRQLGNIDSTCQLFLKVQGQDEILTETNPVDLGRLGVEQIYSALAEKYQFIINEQLFISHEPFISEPELRKICKIPPDDDLYLKEEGKDYQLSTGEKVDLKPFPIEEFYSKKISKLVTIKIDNQPYQIKTGDHSLEELIKLGHVKPGYILEQLIDGKLVAISAAAMVNIKGGEEFKSFVKDGQSA